MAWSKRIRKKSRYLKGTERTNTGERLHHGHTLGEWAEHYGCGVQQNGLTEFTKHCRQMFNEVLILVNQDLATLNQPKLDRYAFEWIKQADVVSASWDRTMERYMNSKAFAPWPNRDVSTPMYCSPVMLTSFTSRTNASIRNDSSLVKRGFMEMSCSTSSLTSVEFNVAKRCNENHNLIENDLHYLQHTANVIVPHTDVLHLVMNGTYDTILESNATCHVVNSIQCATPSTTFERTQIPTTVLLWVINPYGSSPLERVTSVY